MSRKNDIHFQNTSIYQKIIDSAVKQSFLLDKDKENEIIVHYIKQLKDYRVEQYLKPINETNFGYFLHLLIFQNIRELYIKMSMINIDLFDQEARILIKKIIKDISKTLKEFYKNKEDK